MWNYVLLGVIQGIFEWLPVSSEGIVAVTSQFTLQEFNPVDTAIFLHLGTLLAVLVYFFYDWKQVVLIRDKELFRFLFLATITSLVVGFPLYLLIKNLATGAILLLVMGFGLLATSYFHGTRKSVLGLDKHQDRLAIVAGLLQGLAVIPGLSRSGSTIFGLSLGKGDPSQILRLSYLMSAPVVLVSTVYFAVSNPTLFQSWPSLISSFLVGIASLSFLMKLAERINFRIFTLIFAVLCFVGGIILLVF